MSKFFQSSANIFRSLFNSIVSLSCALENFSQASLIKSELHKMKIDAQLAETLENKEDFLEKIYEQHKLAKQRSKLPIIFTLIVFALLIVIF